MRAEEGAKRGILSYPVAIRIEEIKDALQLLPLTVEVVHDVRVLR